jgi:hypothetical protein
MLMSERSDRVRAGGAVVALVLFLAIWASANAMAATPKLLTQFPEDVTSGAGANQLDLPLALAADPSTGDLYVAEEANHRISVFTPWGAFVRDLGWGVQDGSPALQECGPAEPEVDPPPSLCQKGLAGSGPGQMQSPNGVAVDSAGNVYVLERFNLRVQKFNAAGEFVLMFGGEVNKSNSANVCTKVSGEICGIGIAGTGNGAFNPPPSPLGSYLSVGSDGTVYVGDQDRIQAFEPNGTFKTQFKFSDLHAENAAFPETGQPAALAFDFKSGDLYFGFSGGGTATPRVYRLDPATGKLVNPRLEAIAPETGVIEALSTDSNGNVYMVFDPGSGGEAILEPRVLEFGPDGEVLVDFAAEFAAPPTASSPFLVTQLLGLATNSAGDLYVAEDSGANTSSISAYGPPPIALGPPPKRPPAISAQFAISVDTVGARVRAQINPRFWSDATYYVEYGTASCETSSCAKVPIPPGPLLTSDVINAPLTTASVFLGGLLPNTTYHYRFVAQSTGGGPVKGLEGKTGEAGEGTFTTFPLSPEQPPCPANDAFRPGPAAFLADCRAYEMVSPVDKNGADISVVFESLGDRAGLDQAAIDGEKLSFSAYRAFGEVESSPYASQYLATRAEGVGWSSKSISPPRKGSSLYHGGPGLDSQFKGFSDDLCQGWVLQDSDISLAEGWFEGFPNLYRREVCEGGYQSLAPLKAPTGVEASHFRPEVQGFSADGSTAIFIADGKLTNTASTASQLYESSPAGLRLVCILPSKAPLAGSCTGGTQGSGGVHPDRSASVSHAISEGGRVIYWTEGGSGPGKLYARVDHTETIAVNGGSAQFWAASADGSKAIYSVGAELFEFNLASKSSKPIADGFQGVLGASDDATKVYFVSNEVLATGGTGGKPNLYLFEAGEPGDFSFVATLVAADADTSNGVLSATATWPIRHVSRVTPDGGAVAFMSAARLTDYDNTDANSGRADSEVYLYRVGQNAPVCVSCNPSGARPAGRDIKHETNLINSFWAAAQIPVAENQLHFPRVLSDDGTRLFFESFDPLVLRDTNSQNDVYEWEVAGVGNCSAKAPGFRPSLGGCVNLISSGESPQDSEFVDSSADGRDVFFKTASSLLPQDPGLVDVYDARAAGGFPLQEPLPPGCQGEACQTPAPAPNDPTPSSQNVGPPNQLDCPKGKHRVKRNGKQSCVKAKKSGKHKKHKAKKKHGTTGKKGRATR